MPQHPGTARPRSTLEKAAGGCIGPSRKSDSAHRGGFCRACRSARIRSPDGEGVSRSHARLPDPDTSCRVPALLAPRRKRRMKIYTKTGDKGDTRLFNGTKVRKHDDRVEAYGDVDELN